MIWNFVSSWAHAGIPTYDERNQCPLLTPLSKVLLPIATTTHQHDQYHIQHCDVTIAEKYYDYPSRIHNGRDGSMFGITIW